MKISAASILNHYFDSIEILKVEQLNTGLINQTFDIDTNRGHFILQRINKGVFKNISSLMNNKVKVTKFLSEKGFPVSNFILTLNKEDHIEDQNEIWHLSEYIQSFTKERMTVETASEIGVFIASFHKKLLDFPINELEVTIPDFHNTIKRYTDFLMCIKNTNKEKLFETRIEIEKIEIFFKFISPLAYAINSGEIPIRIVHNDTKITNFLFDSTDKVLCLIDFDTIMAGTILSDIGDAMRSGSNESDENEKELKLVKFNSEIYDAFMSAYLKEADSFLTTIEKKYLHLALPLILFEQACRFLSDYYNGDIYYPTSYSTHNLDRAKTQLKMLTEVLHYFERTH